MVQTLDILGIKLMASRSEVIAMLLAEALDARRERVAEREE